MRFFSKIADGIVRTLGPRTVLDVGCGKGFLVEALIARGVAATGIDISEYAISCVREDLRSLCRVGSVLELTKSEVDLVTCIEVLEHLPTDDVRRAVSCLTEASDTILFSSTPSGYVEVTHQSVLSTLEWIQIFQECGFFCDATYNASFITGYALLFRKDVHKRYSLGAAQAVVGSYRDGNRRAEHGRVLIIGGCDGGPFRYRCEHQAEQAELLHWRADRFHLASYRGAIEIEKYEILLLQRVAFSKQIANLVEAFRRRSKPVIFDTDDLVFDAQNVAEDPEYRHADRDRRGRYLEYTRSLAMTMSLCNGIIVATESLKEHSLRLFPEIPHWVNRNAVNDFMIAQSEVTRTPRVTMSTIRIGYFSGTATHERDFIECSDALRRLCEVDRNVRLTLMGRIDVPEVLMSVLERIDLIPYVHWRDLPSVIASVHINLAPLERHSRFTQCKSAVKFLEAGLMGVPTVASSVGAYALTIKNGINGWLCNTSDEWLSTLTNIVGDESERIRVGRVARQWVLENETTYARKQNLAAIFEQVMDK